MISLHEFDDCPAPIPSSDIGREALIVSLLPHFKTAVDKESPSDLTEIEVSAILFFGGAPYTLKSLPGESMRIEFPPSAIIKQDGKWIVGIRKD